VLPSFFTASTFDLSGAERRLLEGLVSLHRMAHAMQPEGQIRPLLNQTEIRLDLPENDSKHPRLAMRR